MMVPDPARRIGCGLPDRAEHLNSATRSDCRAAQRDRVFAGVKPVT